MPIYVPRAEEYSTIQSKRIEMIADEIQRLLVNSDSLDFIIAFSHTVFASSCGSGPGKLEAEHVKRLNAGK